MKQGTGRTTASARKVEPVSKAKNVERVADIGLAVLRTKPYADAGRGYKAPMASASNHKSGSQGKH
jgi:hypothetical protein